MPPRSRIFGCRTASECRFLTKPEFLWLVAPLRVKLLQRSPLIRGKHRQRCKGQRAPPVADTRKTEPLSSHSLTQSEPLIDSAFFILDCRPNLSIRSPESWRKFLELRWWAARILTWSLCRPLSQARRNYLRPEIRSRIRGQGRQSGSRVPAVRSLGLHGGAGGQRPLRSIHD